MKRIVTTLLCLVAICMDVSAQISQTSFMLDNHVYGYRFNPAYIPEKSFFAIGIGNVNPTLQSSIGLSNLIFPTDDGLVTGLNSAVSSETFLGGLKKNNPFNVDVHENILSIGFRGRNGGYSTIEVNARAMGSASLPYDAFAFLKDAGGSSYDLTGFDLGLTAYGEVAYGFSKMYGDRFGLGFRVKGLVGLADLTLDVSKAQIRMDGDRIAVAADARMDAAATFMEVATKKSEYEEGCSDVMDFPSFYYDYKMIRPTGYGGAVDLGIMLEPIRGLEIHLAVCDLGMMAWNYNVSGQTNAEVEYTGEQISASQESSDSEFGKEMKAALHTLESLAEFHQQDAPGYKCSMLPFRVNAALKYRMPFWRRLAVGAVGTYRYSDVVQSYDVRAALSMTPGNWFSITTNAGYSSFGPVCGAAFSLNAGPFCMFTSVDGYIGRIALWTPNPDKPKLAVPYPVNRFGYSMSFGFVVQFGKRLASKYDRYTEVDSE